MVTNNNKFWNDVKWLELKEIFFKKSVSPIFIQLRNRAYSKILDCGTGIGCIPKALNHILTYEEIIGIDVNEGFIEYAKKRFKEDAKIKFQVGDILNLAFEDSYFDLIVAQEVLEHIPGESNIRKALFEMKRVLKNNGQIIVIDCGPSIFIEPSTKLDNTIFMNFNRRFLDLRGSDSSFGRKLWHYMSRAGFRGIEIIPTPWLLYPAPSFSISEKQILKKIICKFFLEANIHSENINETKLRGWLKLREKQIDDDNLVFFVECWTSIGRKKDI